jgi:threonine dehydratase
VTNTPGDAVLVTLADIRAAADRIRAGVLVTPLLPFGPGDPDDPRGRPRAWLKPESLQSIGAFKIRGALNAIAQLTREEAAAGVVTHSSGNHAQGVARAARLLGVRAVIVMPRNAPAIKVERVRADGAEIIFVGPSSEERADRAAELAERDRLSLVPPFDDARVIAGQGTVGLEIVEQTDDLDAVPTGDEGDEVPATPGLTVLVPIGGGGLASGVSTAVKALRPDAVVVGVEPKLAADAQESLLTGRLVRWAPERVGATIADGMRSTQIGRLPFAHLSRYLDGVVTVAEDEIAAAMARAADDARLVVEPSGATTLAAWLFHEDKLPAGNRVVVVLSGGNVDPERWAELVAQGRAQPAYRGAAAQSDGV